MQEESKAGDQYPEVTVHDADPFDRAAQSDEDDSPSKKITPLAYDRTNPIF